MMPETYKQYSYYVLGYVAEQTPVNEKYITTLTIQKMIEKGKTPEQIFLGWNAGNAKRCSSGVNKYGVKYDSCAYVQNAMQHYKKLIGNLK